MNSSPVHFGLKWTSLSLGASKAVRFLTTIALYRLITDEILGLVILANAAIFIIGTIRELGFGHAFIQREDRSPEETRLAADTTFVLSMVINLGLFAAAWLAAPWVVKLMEEPEDWQDLESVLRVMYASFLLEPFLTTPLYILQKDLRFGRLAFAEILASVAHAVIAVGLALMGAGVWSLVGGQLGSTAFQAAILMRQSNWRPKWRFDRAIAGQLFSYGKYLWAFSAVSTIGGQLDRLIVGRVLGRATLGHYGLAFYLCNLPATQVADLVNRIAFPAFSRKQKDLAALSHGFLKALSHVAIVTFPLAFGLLAVAEELVLTLYTYRWLDAAPIIQVLGFYGLTLSLASTAGPVLKAIGRPNIILYTSLLHQTVLVIMLLTLSHLGVLGIAWAVVVPMLVSGGIAFLLIMRYLKIALSALMLPMVRCGSCALLMFAAVKLARDQLAQPWSLSPLLGLLLEVPLGVLVYLVSTWVLNRSLLLQFVDTVKCVLGAQRQTDAEPIFSEVEA